MATVIATINVNFTSNYVGCHRLFWRRGAVGPYNGPVEAVPPCTGNGNPCSISFYDVVDTEACDPISYEGYVQACCEDVLSIEGRIPFNVTYTPTPECLPLEITCARVEVASVEVLNPGSGYAPLPTPPPAVTIIGGGPTSIATATAVVGTGGITNLLITINGSGPGIAPATYAGVAGTNIVGTGTSVVVDATSLNTLPGPYPNGGTTYINTVTLVSSSNDWTVGDTFELNSASIGGITGPVTVTVGATDLGTITGFILVSPGSEYVSQPSVSIAPPPVGVQATAFVVLAGCANLWSAGLNCQSLPTSYSAFPIEPELGQTFTMCFQGGSVTTGSIPTDYDVAPNSDCCSSCIRYQVVNNSADPIDVAWLDCNPLNATFKDVISDTVNAGDTLQICCAVENSLSLSSSTSVVVTTPGSCNCAP